MANEILGSRKYLVLATETTWGATPVTPEYVHLPVTDYSVRFKPENRQSRPFLGVYQRKHSRNFRGLPAGQLRSPLYGWQTPDLGISLAQYLLDWSFGSPEATELPSKLGEWAEGPNVANKRHNGLRVNTATVQGSAEAGVVELQLELQGKSEAGQDVVPAAQPLPENRHLLSEFEFTDCTFQLAGSPLLLKSFQVRIEHGLKAEYLNSFTPSLLLKTQRVVSLQLVPVKNADTYDAFRRAAASTEVVGQIVLKGLSQGTGTPGKQWTVATLDFPRLSFVDADEEGGIDDIAFQTLRLLALKPDTAASDLTITWSEI